MELPWALLALAGMGAAADLGDSLGDRQRGTGAWRGCEAFVPGRGLWGWAWLGGPHQCCPPRAGTL